MSQLSKVKHRRDQWKHKATQRGAHNRDQRKQIARITVERNRATQALKAAQARLHQLESQPQGLVALPKVDVVLLALQLFFVARIGFRAVSRVLSLLALALGIKKAPCPQTIINWVIRLSIVRLDRSEEHTSELQSRLHLVCRLLLEKKKKTSNTQHKVNHYT